MFLGNSKPPLHHHYQHKLSMDGTLVIEEVLLEVLNIIFLTLIIQCAKLLSDTSVIQFYPSKFVLITDILDNFGKPNHTGVSVEREKERERRGRGREREGEGGRGHSSLLCTYSHLWVYNLF